MSKALDTAHDKVVAGEWSKDQSRDYLRANAINKDLHEKFWRTAQHNLHWEAFVNGKKSEENLVEELGEDVFEEIRKCGLKPIDKPATWDRAQPLALNIDVIMHLLFLGVWSTLVTCGMDWLRMNQMEASFLQYADGLLEKVQSLNLSYCRVLGYKKGKLGGWVSENYLGFARIAGWFYNHFGTTKKRAAYQQPEKEQKKWTKKENAGWLQARLLPQKGNAKELSTQVATYMAQEGGPPPLMETGGGPNTLFLQSVNGLLSLIAVVMQDFVNEELLLEMDYRAKLFLTLFERMDSKMRKPKDKPKAVTTYNFFSLLNLPVAAGMLGPLRNVWEGGPMGEGYLQQIKGAIYGGLKPGWQMRLMNNVHRSNGLSKVLKNWGSEGSTKEEEGEDSEEGDAGLYYKYKSLATLILSFEKGNPISALQLKSGKFGCVLGDSLELVEIRMSLEKGTERVNEMIYVHWDVEQETKMGRLTDKMIANPVLLLPMISDLGTPMEGKEYVYTAVTNMWTKLSENGKFVMY